MEILKLWKGELKTKEDINKLCAIPTSESQIIILRKDHQFVCSVFYSNDAQNWVFYFDSFMTYPANNDHLPTVLSEIGEVKGYITSMDSIHDMFYEIKQSIITTITNKCINDIDDIPNIINRASNDIGKPVMFSDNREGILLGVSATLEDVYYYMINPYGDLEFQSNVSGYDLIAPNNVSVSLNMLMQDPKLESMILKARHDHFIKSDEIEIIGY